MAPPIAKHWSSSKYGFGSLGSSNVQRWVSPFKESSYLQVEECQIVTLPVEFDASNRALRLIDELGILQGEENRGAKQVLDAAALTYVATALYSVLQLAQLLLSRRD